MEVFNGDFKATQKTPPIARNQKTMVPTCDLLTPAYAATLAVTVDEMKTILKPGTLTGNMTLNLTVSDDLPEGAELHLHVTSDGSQRTITMGTKLLAPALVTAASKQHKQVFTYDGTNFVANAAAIQLN